METIAEKLLTTEYIMKFIFVLEKKEDWSRVKKILRTNELMNAKIRIVRMTVKNS